MAQFSYRLNQVPGLRFIADALELQSPIGRQHLMKQKFMTSSKEISLHLDKVEELVKLLLPEPVSAQSDPAKLINLNPDSLKSEDIPNHSQISGIQTNTEKVNSLKHALSEIRDISGTLNALHSGMSLDDIGLFEVKRFALIIDRILSILNELNCKTVEFSDVSQVIAILDPDKQRVPHFYVYDSYSEELAVLRQEYQRLTHDTLKRDYSDDPKGKRRNADLQSVEELRLKSIALEDAIRKKVSGKLRGYSVILLENLSSAADLDLWLSQAKLAIDLGLNKPVTLSQKENTSYKQLFNPAIQQTLRSKGKEFQPVDIEITDRPAVITGANMAGKTVVLKTVALAQTLFQYGFFVPAAEARIVPVEKIMTCMEDEQSEIKGLSSFASEMLKLNDIIHAARSGENILALIDEPARTTNPREGEALVSALLELLNQHKVSSLVTTHYSIDSPKCRRIRVAGLRTDKMTENPSLEAIQDYIDYSLIEQPDTVPDVTVPHEALAIASILNIDKELLNIAARYLEI